MPRVRHTDLSTWSPAARAAAADRIGEQPSSVLAVHALRCGVGRAWVSASFASPRAIAVESALTPGELYGWGDPAALLTLLDNVAGWSCLEVAYETAVAVSAAFTRRWGAHRVVDVVHVLEGEPPLIQRPPVSALTALTDASPRSLPGVLPDDSRIVEAAIAQRRVFVAVDNGRIVGHRSSFAAGAVYADISVHVLGGYRRRGIATAAAAMACQAVRASGLTPVWGTAADNEASLRVAAKLGFVETERLTYLVRNGK